MFERINTLVKRMGFSVKLWNDRYGKGVWAVCTPLAYHAVEICEASSDGDMEMIPAAEYVLSTDWLPVVASRSVVDAMSALEARLGQFTEAALEEQSCWREAVWDALEHFRDVRRSGGHFEELPVVLTQTEANTVSKDCVTSKLAGLLTTEDEIAVAAWREDGRFHVRPIRAIARGENGALVFKHGPVGLAVTEYDDDDQVAIVRR
ncbi:Uncharacterised protein [Burkholderia pseudomallei]|nr:Uncharacterised protein [Burkholderia pseudomallei]CAJ6711751.1 Uncharacterised protein [Burkholderia pseudomallei]HEP6431501.1 hypothetical protein [Burkholderia cenocepacia]